MGVFKTQKTLECSPRLIPVMAEALAKHFANKEFEVTKDVSDAGNAEVSITKGGTFKAVLGMQTSLQIKLNAVDGAVAFDAGVGIWGKQVIPTIITLFVAWPVILSQVWGMIQQSKLDDEALSVVETVIAENARNGSASDGGQFCSKCGTKNPSGAHFCSFCGKPL